MAAVRKRLGTGRKPGSGRKPGQTYTRGPNKPSTHKPWTGMIERALAQYAKGDIEQGQVLRHIADGLVARALAGDPFSIKEIAERLDGKPVQPIAGTGDEGAILHAVEIRIVDPLSPAQTQAAALPKKV